MQTAEKILAQRVRPGQLAVFFLGQAGFVFKDSEGRLTALDPYLSDCCERYFGFKRLTLKPLAPGDLRFDRILASHAHYDHFDVDAMPILMSDPETVLYTSAGGIRECERLGIPLSRTRLLEAGGEYRAPGLKLKAVFCDHGDLAPDAVGLLLYSEGKCVYFAGDTAYRPDRLGAMANHKIDLFIPPVNGAFGNLNEKEAVLLARLLKPALVVPCHYWNFAEHGGDPRLFADTMKELCPEQAFTLMAPGEMLLLS